MPRLMDISALQNRTALSIGRTFSRYQRAEQKAKDLRLMRWIAQMTAVELNATWEHYVEERIVAALNHEPGHFIMSNGILGVKRVSVGLANFIIREGRQYFDFRDCEDLLRRTNRWLTKARNPFSALSADDRLYLDTLSSIRNCIAHQSKAATSRYKKMLRKAYNISAAPGPDEFLYSIDHRKHSPARGNSRIAGLGEVVLIAVGKT